MTSDDRTDNFDRAPDTMLDAFDHDLDALVTGTPADDLASNRTSDPVVSTGLRRAAHQFHGLAARADRLPEDIATRQTLDSIWENVMNAHVPPATTIAPPTPLVPGHRIRPASRLRHHISPSGIPRWHGVLNAVLAAALIFAIGAGFWRASNEFDLGGMRNGAPSSQYAGPIGQVATPAGTPTSGIEQAGFIGLRPQDCTVTPRKREEMISILSTTPSGQEVASTDQGEPSDYRKANPATYNILQEAYFQWQACSSGALTWQVAAMQSEERNRLDMYLTVRHPNVRTPYDTVMPYSPDTLNEILDGWEDADAAHREVSESIGSIQVDEVWVIDPASLDIAPDGSWATFVDTKLTKDRGTLPGDNRVVFVFQDGAWRLDFRGTCCG